MLESLGIRSDLDNRSIRGRVLVMTPQQLIDLPGYGNANMHVIMQKSWDYDYPSQFIEDIQEVTGVTMDEYQRTQIIDVYRTVLEGYP